MNVKEYARKYMRRGINDGVSRSYVHTAEIYSRLANRRVTGYLDGPVPSKPASENPLERMIRKLTK